MPNARLTPADWRFLALLVAVLLGVLLACAPQRTAGDDEPPDLPTAWFAIGNLPSSFETDFPRA